MISRLVFASACPVVWLLVVSTCVAQEAVRNVLFIISDDLKASVLGCYGDPLCKTPNIDRLATDGMLFESAYCQGTWCAPSRQSFMFSRYHGKSNMNLGQHFRENGWYSARVGKIYHMRVPGDIIDGTDGKDEPSSWTERFNSPGQEAHSPGDYACLNLNIFTDAPENRQSTAMPHRMFVSVEIDGDGRDQPDYRAASKAIELLDEHRDRPFFLAVGLVRPHYPMVAPRKYFATYPWQNIQLPEVPDGDLDDIPKLGLAGTLSGKNPIGNYPDNQKRMWSAYYASVSFMDEQVGRILRHLDQLGLRDSTAIVFTSDHGYHLGEHTFWQKSNLHEQVVRVPLIIDAPGMKSGRSNSLVELVDIFPTLSQLAGLDIPSSVQGESLVPILQDPEAKVKECAFSFDQGVAIRTQRWHYLQYNDGTHELYDMQEDPHQFTNLADKEAFQATVQDLRDKIIARQ
ncbi:MAG: sulfatase [Planctomycetales bacterium]|nr:sulfatase [Planctomycetales bacterium]